MLIDGTMGKVVDVVCKEKSEATENLLAVLLDFHHLTRLALGQEVIWLRTNTYVGRQQGFAGLVVVEHCRVLCSCSVCTRSRGWLLVALLDV